MITLLRPPVAFKRLGLSKSVAYERMKAELLMRPIKLGDGRASAFPDFEVEIIARAYIAGTSDDQMRVIVRRLHAQRRDPVVQEVAKDADATIASGGRGLRRVPAIGREVAA